MVGSELKRCAKVGLGFAVGTYFFFKLNIVSIRRIEGISMQPTFNPNCAQTVEELRVLMEAGLPRESLVQELTNRKQEDTTLVNNWVVGDKKKLKIGDVVVFISPKDPTITMVKRLVAMPGDVIQSVETGETKAIDDGHCWVEGDNQQSSYDSNDFGQIPLGLIRGRVFCIIWPPTRIRTIKCDPNISNSSTTIRLDEKKLTSQKYR